MSGQPNTGKYCASIKCRSREWSLSDNSLGSIYSKFTATNSRCWTSKEHHGLCPEGRSQDCLSSCPRQKATCLYENRLHDSRALNVCDFKTQHYFSLNFVQIAKIFNWSKDPSMYSSRISFPLISKCWHLG